MAAESKTAVLAALAGNAALAVLKGVAAAATGSAAMLAETFHSVADTGNQALLFLGMRLSRRPPDSRHPFGHGKNVYFWAFVVSAMLFTLGGGVAIWEAVQRLHHPGEHEIGYAWAYGVLAGGFVFEAASLAVAVRSLVRDKGHERLREYLRDLRDPTLLTVLLEDSAALASLVVAVAGLAASQLTGNGQLIGNGMWDGIASGLIGLILVGVAVVLAFENYSLLLGESAPRGVQRRIRAIAGRHPAVAAVLSLHTMHVGPESLLVALELQFRDRLTAAQVAGAVREIESAISRAVGPGTPPELVLIEPGRSGPRRRFRAA